MRSVRLRGSLQWSGMRFCRSPAIEKAAAWSLRLRLVRHAVVNSRLIDYGIRPMAFSLQEGQFGGIAWGNPLENDGKLTAGTGLAGEE